VATTIESAIAFIESLELPDAGSWADLESGEVQLVEGAQAGYVDAGSLVSFGPGVSAQHKNDVLNSSLLAQLAANKKFDREKQTKEWYAFYRDILERVGWVLRGFEFSKYESNGADFTADKVILEILKALATGNDLAVVAATMEALNSLGNDSPTLKIFETSSHTASSGNFQVSIATESDSIVGMKIGAFYFQTTQQITRVLWFRFSSSSTNFYKGSQIGALDEEVYAQVRQSVVEKLGDAAKKLVRDIEI
jgi:hypothetical protein